MIHQEDNPTKIETDNLQHRVAILLATFNGQKFIERQLSTILAQRDVSVEIYISDDLSTDNTLNIIKNYESKFSNLHVISYDKKFGSAAQNFYHLTRTVDVSKFDYVAFSDQDDVWGDIKLINAISSLKEFKSSAYSSNFYAVWQKTGKRVLVRKNYPQTKIDHWFEGPGPGCSQVFSVTAFTEFQKFITKNWSEIQEVSYHDWLIYAFMRHRGISWHISDSPDFDYIQHDSNDTGANNGINAFLKRIKMLKSGWYRGQVNLIHNIVTGKSSDLFCLSYIFKNILGIRRKKNHAALLLIAIILRLV